MYVLCIKRQIKTVNIVQRDALGIRGTTREWRINTEMVVPIFNDQIILCFLLNNSCNLRLCGIRNMNTDASNDFKHFMSFCIYSIMPTNDVKSKKHF